MALAEEEIRMDRDPSTNISILIVGAGLAGLAAAIECYRKGHNVRIVERNPKFEELGDFIAIGPSALRTPSKWPGFLDRVRKHSHDPCSHVFKYDGTPVGVFRMGTPDQDSLGMSRAILHRQLWEYARGIGLQVEFGTTIESYYETDEKGGAIDSTGKKFEADIVFAADGVGSPSWSLITGHKDKPITSGYAVYRATFPVGPVLENPVVAREYEGLDDRISLYIGHNTHIVIARSKTTISWMLTYKEDGSATESWSKTVSAHSALNHVKDWYPFLPEVIKATPGMRALDWKLMWRNPQPKWVSPKGRVLQVGDSAHSFLPSSGSGATMAWEDAFSIAACLQVAGKDDIPTAARVHNALRFERVSSAQKMGFKAREVWHHTDWDAVAKNPDLVGRTIGKWIMEHDPEQYAVDNYEDCRKHVISGTQFRNTNGVPGYTYKPWDISTLAEASEKGEPIIDEGEWV
ncbi:unnamed protein product [Penicillium glandicola]